MHAERKNAEKKRHLFVGCERVAFVYNGAFCVEDSKEKPLYLTKI